MKKKSIGKILFIRIELFKAPSEDEKNGKLSWRVDPEISGGGHFFDLASHQLDYLDFLFGPVQNVKSIVLNQAGFIELKILYQRSFYSQII